MEFFGLHRKTTLHLPDQGPHSQNSQEIWRKPGAKVVIELYKGKASKDLQYRAGIETKVYTPRPRRPNFYRSMDRPPGTRVSPPPKKFFEAGTS